MMIQDGSGRGFAAKVGPDNRLAVDSGGGMTDGSLSSRGWMFSNYRQAETLTVTATGGYVFILQNTSSNTVVVEDVTLSTDTASVFYTSWVGAATGTLANNNTIQASTLNSGATGVDPGFTINIWDEVGDGMTGITGGSPCTTVLIAAGTTVVDSGSAIVVPPGGSFTGKLENASECTFNIRFYEVSL